MSEIKCTVCGVEAGEEILVGGVHGQLCSSCIYTAVSFVLKPGLEKAEALVPSGPESKRCGFCANSQSEATGMVGYSNFCICLKCLGLCVQTAAESRLNIAQRNEILAIPLSK